MDFLLLLSRIFEEQAYLVFPILFAFAFFTVKRKKIFLISLFLILLLTPLIKDFYAISRPCERQLNCIEGFGFPSTHAALSGFLLSSSLGSPTFFIMLPLSLLISYSRVYLFLHSFNQVLAGFVFGMVVYFLVWVCWTKLGDLKWMKNQRL